MSAVTETRSLLGKAIVRRIGRWRFPVFELSADGIVLARMGRTGWFRIYFGFGQRIELADGSRWRLRSVGEGGAICPVVVDPDLRKVAIAAPRFGGYGVNCKDAAFMLYPAERRRFLRANKWWLREHEDVLASVSRIPPSVEAVGAVPLGVVFLCLALVQYGIPGEAKLWVPSFSWRTV